MRALLIVGLSCVVLTGIRPALAGNRIDLYTDMTMSTCELADTGPSSHTVYVFMVGPDLSKAVRFAAPKPDCWVGATWVGDTVPATSLTIGDSQTDWSVAFLAGTAGCPVPPVFVGAINFVATGQALSCCEMAAVDPGTQFVYTDCVPNVYNEYPLSSGQKVVINPDGSCGCLQPLATQPSTWGRVKALYR